MRYLLLRNSSGFLAWPQPKNSLFFHGEVADAEDLKWTLKH